MNYFTARDVVEAFIKTEIRPIAGAWDERILYPGGDVSCGCAVVALTTAAGQSIANHPDRGILPPIYVAEHILGGDAFFLQGMTDGWDRIGLYAPAYETPGAVRRWTEGYRQGAKARRWVDRFGYRYGLAVR